MNMLLKSPAQYIQGNGVLANLETYLKGVGTNLLFIISASGMKRVGETIENSLPCQNYPVVFRVSNGHCTMKEIEATKVLALEKNCSAIIGVGGGNILDTAKAAAHLAGLPCVMIPTVASNDSPCSSCSVVYKDTGTFDRCIFLDDCPHTVLVDTGVILKSPIRFLVAGMGDAMATYFEARSCRESGSDNQHRAKPAMTATAMAALCWKFLKEYGAIAKRDAEAGMDSPAFETIVEVNTYLSSVGFESGGLAAAHAIQTGLMSIPCMNHMQHGELVAFCTIVQLVMEGVDMAELEDVLRFCLTIGLPVSFEDLGYTRVDKNELSKAAHLACGPRSTIHNLPITAEETGVYKALIQTDSLGRAFKEEFMGNATK